MRVARSDTLLLVKLRTRPKWKMKMPPNRGGNRKRGETRARGVGGVIIRETCGIEKKKGRQGGKHRFDSGRRGDDKQKKKGGVFPLRFPLR